MQLANEVGLKHSRIADIANGRTRRMSAEVVKAICMKFPTISEQWLLYGTGEIEVSVSEPEPTNTNQTDQLIQVLLERMKDVNDQMTENTAILRRSQDLFERVLELYEKKVKQADYNPAANYNIAAETIADNSTGNTNK